MHCAMQLDALFPFRTVVFKVHGSASLTSGEEVVTAPP